MNAPLTRCHCAECAKLDRLPVRRHGIPHAHQTTFDLNFGGSGRWPVAYSIDGDTVTVFELEGAGEGMPRPAPSTDSLPLFAGPLQPTLF